MSYLNFHLYFTIPQTLLLLLLCFFTVDRRLLKNALIGQSVLALLALIYTTPWDNYLIYKKVWWYSVDRVIGSIGYVPIEEYFFFIIQCFFTGSLVLLLMKKFSWQKLDPENNGNYLSYVTIAYFLMGILCLFFNESFYLGLILTWGCPILLLQQYFGRDILSANSKLYFWAVCIPSLYLGVADAIAIKEKIWHISYNYTLEVKLFGVLPLEEFVFFLMTNLMLVQGLILFLNPISLERAKIFISREKKITS